MKKTAILVMFLFVIITGCATVINDDTTAVPLANNPIVQSMPDILPEMQTAGYWIGKADKPDEIIMSANEIMMFNSVTTTNHRLAKISTYKDYKPDIDIYLSIKRLYDAMSDQDLYFEDGSYADNASLSALYDQLQLDKLDNKSSISVSFGIITQNISQRLLPTDRMFMRKGATYGYLDRLQMNSLNVGAPVAVLWSTKDENWLFVQSALTIGWVKTEHVALCSRNEIIVWENPEKFVVNKKYKTSVYSDPSLHEYISWLTLGGRMPVDKTAPKKNNCTAILWPYRNNLGWLKVSTGYVENSAISGGYLPYTSRNAINLAFEMLHAPYGWGGMNGEDDCSGFIIKVFSAMGLILPRNSAQQGNTGDIIYSAKEIAKKNSDNSAKKTAKKVNDNSINDISNNVSEYIQKETVVSSGVPGVTVLQFPGHIMLYLGSVNNDPYVIHAIWSFEVKNNDDSVTLLLPSRVVVSHLNLSGHTKRGAFHERLTNVRVMRLSQTASK
ncbi:MAG: SH3 domain-containing protein [Deferribacteraceae bacterium]|jgi:hypothetical protein|nr:SH3 domain-containing protein [Deferribacteraceae bacterium]